MSHGRDERYLHAAATGSAVALLQDPLTTVVIFVAIGIALFYIFVGRLIQSMVGAKPKKAKKL